MLIPNVELHKNATKKQEAGIPSLAGRKFELNFRNFIWQRPVFCFYIEIPGRLPFSNIPWHSLAKVCDAP